MDNLAPREKLQEFGVNHLSNAELLAIIFGVGNRQESVLEMTKRVIQDYGVNSLAQAKDYQKLAINLKLGRVKSMQLTATLELGRRIFAQNLNTRPLLNSPKKVFTHFQDMKTKPREELRALYLNTRQNLIATELISIGGTNFVTVQIKDVIRPALEANATGIILIHNHPSGNPTPSEGDTKTTENIYKACLLMDLTFIDHIIIAESYFSYREQGLLNHQAQENHH